MVWMSLPEAAAALKLSESGIRNRRKTGNLRSRPHATYRNRYEYWVEKSPDQPEKEPEKAEKSPDPPKKAEKEQNSAPEERFELDLEPGEDAPYYFDKPNDTYIFSLPSHAKAFVMPGDTVRSINAAYSNADGAPAGVEEIARRHGLRRQTVIELLRALRKTHASGPYTDEVLASTPEDELVEDLVRAKEERVLTKAERIRWDQIKKYAEKAERLDRFIFDRLKAMDMPVLPRPPRVRRKGLTETLSVQMTPTDLHYGSDGYAYDGGERYTREVCAKRLVEKTNVAVERVTRYGNVQDWIVGIGSDWFHVDNPQHQTTRGTPMDVDGTYSEILREGCALFEEYITILRGAGDVHLHFMGGNHDWSSSLFLLQWMRVRFHDAPDVHVHYEVNPRIYIERGKNLIGLTHGDSGKFSDLPITMMSEAGEALARCPHRYYFTGHLHHELIDNRGVMLFKQPSLAGADRWHHKNGFVGSREALIGYVFDHDEGLVARISASV